MMKSPKVKKLLAVLRFLPLALCVTAILLYFLYGRNIDAEMILQYVPASPWLAAAFLLFLYAVKSLTVFFPIIILQIAGGVLFSPIPAILVNLLGAAIEMSVPYGIGKLTGSASIEQISKKHPKLVNMIEQQQRNRIFLSFFLRIISCLPGDAVSMYLGAIQIPFSKYLTGSILGALPGVITATLIGASISDPASPMFWFSIGLTIALSATSMCIYIFYQRKKDAGIFKHGDTGSQP